jgi:protein-L-isoaspartate(D-aspartate) O-methyltransferase
LPKPQLLGKILQAADITADDHVLVVGGSTGYSAAVIARLAKSVVALEENAGLAARARDALAGLANVTLAQGELAKGWPSAGLYDVIIFDGATEIEPHGLCGQLRDGGRLMCVLSNGPGGKAMIYRRSGASTAGRQIFDAVAPVLPGFTRREAFAF